MKKKTKENDLKFTLQEELSQMMVAFGEFDPPNQHTLQLLEIYLLDFLDSILTESYRKAKRAGHKDTIKIGDLLREIQFDEMMFLRVPALLRSLERMKEFRSITEDPTKNFMKNFQ
ncbi:unnamed protein product [Moneuplotes crassus]|uniref:Transcription initiation factor TFIID subunit 13 n=1 Tax=Euplotes crassus TaxID=5936 RepID=A0AAD1Y4H1_EUPCR|nr:unnamed protein product [Moneuplotes crassus]